ncbi:MAG: hypothetical protein ACXWP0_04390 [Ktedonobacterales bacterium]
MATATLADAVLDFDALNEYLIAAVDHYEHAAPKVSAWLDDLYRRIFNTPEQVVLSEIIAALHLHSDNQWTHGNFAQNSIYKLIDRLGGDTTGWLDF